MRDREKEIKKRETWTLREMDLQGVREWGNLWSRVLLFLYTWECTAGGKEGNGVQMYCIKHRGLNFNRYITMRSPAALPFQTSKPPSTFLTLPATAPPPPPLLPTHTHLPDSPFLALISAACPVFFFSLSVAEGCIHFTLLTLFSFVLRAQQVSGFASKLWPPLNCD